jgi:hypothetical protein
MVAVLAHQQEHTADAQPVHQEVLHAAEPYQLRVRHIAVRFSLQISFAKVRTYSQTANISAKKLSQLSQLDHFAAFKERTSLKSLHFSKILPIFAPLIIYEYAKTAS